MMDFSIRLHVNSEGKDVVFVLQTIDLPSDKRSGFSYGDQVGYRFKSELIHLFNAETRKNLI